MKLSFILVHPQRGENVGAAARALKTMGFSDLRLVGEPRHKDKAARILAHRSEDILEHAQCFSSLEAALADVDLAIGTTAKARHQRRYHYSPEQLAASLSERHDSLQRAAILFGCEPHGLANKDIALCDLLSQIPLASPQPSLNLAQSVMLYCYALSPLAHPRPSPAADRAQYRALRQRVARLFAAIGVDEGEKSGRWAMERLAQGRDEDIKFLHFLCARIEARLENDRDT